MITTNAELVCHVTGTYPLVDIFARGEHMHITKHEMKGTNLTSVKIIICDIALIQ
jgi:hypothetical protein